jgi:hypothetical protein
LVLARKIPGWAALVGKALGELAFTSRGTYCTSGQYQAQDHAIHHLWHIPPHWSRRCSWIGGRQAAVTTHISSALEALRKQHSVASVFLDTNQFRQQDAQYHAGQSAALAFPSADTIEFNRVAMTLLNQLFRTGYLYRKAGVMIAGIESDTTGRQVDFLHLSQHQDARN